MFEITISNAKIFKNCIDAIVTLIDEGEFDIAEDGVKLRAMDPSQIAMIDFVMPKHAFEKYEVKASRIGINLEDLAKVMARVRQGESLTMKMEDNKARLTLIFKGDATRRIVIPLLDLGGTTPRSPNIEFETSFRINGGFFKESLKDAQLVSSHVVLRSADEKMFIEAEGDKGEVNIEASKEKDMVLDLKMTKGARAMFPLEYLNDILKSADADVFVGLRTDAPLKIEYPIGDAVITYFLAPRIETA